MSIHNSAKDLLEALKGMVAVHPSSHQSNELLLRRLQNYNIHEQSDSRAAEVLALLKARQAILDADETNEKKDE